MLKTSLRDTWSFFRQHWVALAAIILPLAIPVDLFSVFYDATIASEDFVFSEQIIPIGVTFLVYPIYAAAVVFYLRSVIAGQPQDTASLWRLGLRYWVPYVVLSLLFGIAVSAGFMLLVVPGIIIGIRFAFAEFDLLLNDSSPTDALKSSWQQTERYFWTLFGGYALITVALYIPFYVIGGLFDTESALFWLISVIMNATYAVLSTLYTIFSFRVYDFSREQALESGASV